MMMSRYHHPSQFRIDNALFSAMSMGARVVCELLPTKRNKYIYIITFEQYRSDHIASAYQLEAQNSMDTASGGER